MVKYYKLIIFEVLNAFSNLLYDTPAFVRASLICLSFSIHVTSIFSLSIILRIDDISTIKPFSRGGFKLCTASYKLSFSVYVMMSNWDRSTCAISNIYLLKYIASSHPPLKDKVLAAIVEHTTLFIFDEFWYSGRVRFFESV